MSQKSSAQKKSDRSVSQGGVWGGNSWEMLSACLFLAKGAGRTRQLIASIELEDWKWTALQQRSHHWNSTLTFILALFDMTWRARLGWSHARAASTCFPLPQPFAICPSLCPGKEGDPTQPTAVSCRKGSSLANDTKPKVERWRSRKCCRMHRQCSYASLTVGRLTSSRRNLVGSGDFPLLQAMLCFDTELKRPRWSYLIYLEVVGRESSPINCINLTGIIYERKGSPSPRSPGLLWGLTVKVCFLLCVPLVWW